MRKKNPKVPNDTNRPEIDSKIPRPDNNEKLPLENKRLNRRGLFQEGYNEIMKLASNLIEKKLNKVTGHLEFLLRPPGAIPEAEFIKKCTKCGKCEQACGNRAIRIADIQSGILNAGYPYLEIEKKPCVLCTDMPCIKACPDDALIPIRFDEIFLGKVEINKEKCLAHKGEICVSCQYGCSIENALEFKNRKPVINPSHCVGCGICIYACVARPSAIKFIPRKKSFPSFRLRSKLVES